MSKPKKNSDIGVAQLKPTKMEENPDKTVLRREQPDASLTIEAQLAGIHLYCRNFKFKNAAVHFPHDPLLRTVDKYFQFAKGGPLYVDLPTNDVEIAWCKKKAPALWQEGLRYVWITQEMTLEEAWAQLEDPRGVA